MQTPIDTRHYTPLASAANMPAAPDVVGMAMACGMETTTTPTIVVVVRFLLDDGLYLE